MTQIDYVSGVTVTSTFNDFDIITETFTVNDSVTRRIATINIGDYAGFTPYEVTLTETVAAYVVETLQGAGISDGEYLTLIGPTTFTSTVTVASGQAPYYYDARPPSSATQCYPTSVSIETGTARQVTYATQEILTAASDAPAKTIWKTSTELLGPAYNEDPVGMEPGQFCGGLCGFCNLYYPTVSVYYWPVPSPNTACLTSSTAAPSYPGLNARVLHPHPRSLANNDSILVSNGIRL